MQLNWIYKYELLKFVIFIWGESKAYKNDKKMKEKLNMKKKTELANTKQKQM